MLNDPMHGRSAQVPEGAFDLSFAFTDGHGTWDNNDEHNYSAPVRQQPAAAEAAPARSIESVEVGSFLT